MQGVQDVVLQIIRTSHKQDLNLSYISFEGIVEEAKKTSLVAFADKKHVNDKKTMLERKVEQALYHLKKKKAIRQLKRGHWTICKKFEEEEQKREKRKEKEKNKYQPKVCQAIQYEYERHCPKCNTYSYEKSSSKRVLGGKCKECGKSRVTVALFRYYCPIRKTYIGDPVRQCELLNNSDVRLVSDKVDSGKVPVGMKFCYFDHVPKLYEAEDMRNEFIEREAKEADELKNYLSKYHLPRPLGKEVE